MASTETSFLSEEAIQNLEGQIPDLAAGATHAAYVRALAAGRTVLHVEGSEIIASQADGSRQVVGEVKPGRKVVVGQVIKVRRLSADA
jgi:hypothetical protein